jgi:hypothetical protein
MNDASPVSKLSDEGILDWVRLKYEKILKLEVDDIRVPSAIRCCSLRFALDFSMR